MKKLKLSDDIPSEIKNQLVLSGYYSVWSFAEAINEDVNNTAKNLKLQKKLSIPKIIKYAKALDISIEDTLRLFYPEEMAEYDGVE